jgi:predicted transcriptional regulator
MEFTQEELWEAIDKVAWEMLDRLGVVEPPVDALWLAEHEFDYSVRETEPDEELESAPRSRVRRKEIVVRFDQTEESRQAAGARACARELIPRVLARLGVTVTPEHRPATNALVGMIAPRIVLPSRWFGKDCRKLGYDLMSIKERYATAGYEMIAWRWLEFEEPCIVAIVDDGIVSARRSNCSPVNKKLTSTEERCAKETQARRESTRVRGEEATTWSWPIPNGPFGRIVLRSVPNEI